MLATSLPGQILTGLAVVTTDLVAFLDADCLPRPGWLTPLLEQFGDPAVAVVAPRITSIEPLGAPEHPLLTRYERVQVHGEVIELCPDSHATREVFG